MTGIKPRGGAVSAWRLMRLQAPAVLLRMKQPDSLGERNEFCEGLYLGFFPHDFLAVSLDRTFGRPQFARNMLVGLAEDDKFEDLALAWRERRNKCTGGGQ